MGFEPLNKIFELYKNAILYMKLRSSTCLFSWQNIARERVCFGGGAAQTKVEGTSGKVAGKISTLNLTTHHSPRGSAFIFIWI